MAFSGILQDPHPILKSRSRPVRRIDQKVNQVIRVMLHTLENFPGVALAAPQIGILYRIIVCDVSQKAKDNHGRIILINPSIHRWEGRKVFREGCLSVPEYTGNVFRAETIWVRGLDPDGQKVRLTAHGYEALALQHEIDHLEGILFLDRISSLSTDLFRRKDY